MLVPPLVGFGLSLLFAVVGMVYTTFEKVLPDTFIGWLVTLAYVSFLFGLVFAVAALGAFAV